MDEATVQSAKQGHAVAVDALVRHYYDRVKRVCRGILRGEHDAEDAAQEVFVRLRDKLPLYDSARPFEPWLFRLAHNVALNLARCRTPAPLGDDALELSQAPPAWESESREIVRTAVDRLAAEDRAILAYVEQAYQ